MTNQDIEPYITQIIDWAQANAPLLGALVLLSLLSILGALIALPVIIVALPEDYFLHKQRNLFGFSKQHRLLRITLLLVKNIAGLLLLLVGILFLFTPGQGLLTIFVGMMLMNYPGKRALELRLFRIKGVRRGANWIRKKAGKGELQIPLNKGPINKG